MRKLQDWVQSYMSYTEETEPPLLYRQWVALSCVAAALKRKVWLEWELDNKIYTNLYVVLVGPPGKCRKGTAMSSGISLVKDLGIKLAPNSLTREQLIRELADAGDLTITKDKRYMSHASLTILSPELTVFLGYDNKQMITDLTDWYDCADNWEYRTKTQGQDEIVGVWVNMLGATTPHLVQTALPLETFGGGLASRIIFVYEDNKAKVIYRPGAKNEQLRKSLLQDLSEIHRLDGAFSVTESYIDEWTEWYIKSHTEGPDLPPTFEGYLNRRQTHVRKLAMLFSVSESNELILTGQHFLKALSFLTETEKKMPRTFAGVGSSRNSQLMVDIMEYISKRKKLQPSELYQNFYSSIESPRQLNDIVSMLGQQKFCHVVQNGRTTYIEYLTNHRLHGQFGGDSWIPPTSPSQESSDQVQPGSPTQSG